ncbi:MAG: polysaccharide biosynthesis tyrosine autokinase [Verrucomicrobiales bacterium]|nr:polysaccharide biosynthesis tyrosine autokinase [Verrucomicrobiales bacterium]
MSLPSSEVRLHALDYLQIIRNRFPVILLVFFLVFISAVTITHLMPRKFLGRAAVEIVQNDDDLRLFRNSTNPDFMVLNFVQTQFETIKTNETLYRVVDKFDLVNRWGAATRQEAANMLRKNLETSSRRNTNLIDVSVYSTSPEEAAELANAVAQSYADGRLEEEQKRINKALTALESELAKQRERVSVSRSAMLKLMRDGNIIDLARSGNNQETITLTPGVLATSEQQIYDLKQKQAQLTTQLERLNQVGGEDLIKMAVSLDVADASIAQVYPQYLDQSIALERMRNLGLGAKHPKVLALSKEIDKMREYLATGADTIRETLATQLQIATDSLARIEQMHGDKREESMDEREDYVAYEKAKEEYHHQNLLLQNMEANFHQTKIDSNMTSTPIRIHEYAEPDPRPAKPMVLLNLILGGIIGLGMGLTLAFFLEYLDTSVKSIEQVEELLDTNVLAVVPKDVGLLVNGTANLADAEAYRILRTNLEFNRKNPNANVITGVSGSPGEGKSTTITNLAYVCAEGGYTTLLIDADMRRPSLHRNFEVSNNPGLSNFLASSDFRIEDVVLRTSNQNLWFLPSGGLPTDPAGLLNTQRMIDMISEMKRRFDFVFIDAPPILGVSDASVISREADLTMVVVQHRKLPQKTLLRVKQAIENAGGNMIGVVMNNVDVRSDSQYSYYTSYYSYYATPNGPTVPNPKPAQTQPIQTEPRQQPRTRPVQEQPQQQQPVASERSHHHPATETPQPAQSNPNVAANGFDARIMAAAAAGSHPQISPLDAVAQQPSVQPQPATPVASNAPAPHTDVY